MFSKYARTLSLLLSLLFSLYATTSLARSSVDVSVRIGDRLIQALVYNGNGDDLIIWLPSQYGSQNNYPIIASKIQRYGVEVWYVDMFAANYLVPSINTIGQIPPTQVSRLIDQVIQHSAKKRIWIMSGERGAQLVLRGIRAWQKNNPKKNVSLSGAILINPDLTYGNPPVGISPDYLPITYATNKPVVIIQSRFSKDYFYLSELIKQLEKGGAPVKTYILDNVRDRFYFRRFSEEIEDKTRDKKLAPLLIRAISGSRKDIKSIEAHDKLPHFIALPKVDSPLNITPILKPKPLASIALNDINKKPWDTAKMRGKVLFISIWPYWCAGCRYQLQQQQELYEKIKEEDFQLLSIYFDGTKTQLKKLIKRYQITFPLLEGDPTLIKSMNLRTFPSTLIVDKSGKVRYAMYGIPRKQDSRDLIHLIDTLRKKK